MTSKTVRPANAPLAYVFIAIGIAYLYPQARYLAFGQISGAGQYVEAFLQLLAFGGVHIIEGLLVLNKPNLALRFWLAATGVHLAFLAYLIYVLIDIMPDISDGIARAGNYSVVFGYALFCVIPSIILLAVLMNRLPKHKSERASKKS